MFVFEDVFEKVNLREKKGKNEVVLIKAEMIRNKET